MATVIAAHPPGGVRLSKRAIQRNQEITLLRGGAGAGEPRLGPARQGRGPADPR